MGRAPRTSSSTSRVGALRPLSRCRTSAPKSAGTDSGVVDGQARGRGAAAPAPSPGHHRVAAGGLMQPRQRRARQVLAQPRLQDLLEDADADRTDDDPVLGEAQAAAWPRRSALASMRTVEISRTGSSVSRRSAKDSTSRVLGVQPLDVVDGEEHGRRAARARAARPARRHRARGFRVRVRPGRTGAGRPTGPAVARAAARPAPHPRRPRAGRRARRTPSRASDSLQRQARTAAPRPRRSREGCGPDRRLADAGRTLEHQRGRALARGR